ncbi:MAG TPA: alpha/beta hydrolase, partial [Spirochaetota bacterium]|nr:alpha/beta hydrolase [Spirochaetota bacterium]
IRLIKSGKKKLVLNDFYNNVFDFVTDKQEIIKKLLDLNIDEEYLINGLKSLLEIDLRDKIKNIDKKTLIIQGEKDTITPVYGAEYIKNNIISSKLIKKPLGHSILFENTEETVKEYEDFINER